MQITIQEAQGSDAQQALTFTKTIGAQSDNLTFGAEGLPFTVEQEESYLNNTKESSNELFLIAKDAERIVGTANISFPSRERLAHRGEIGIAVAKEYWGHGIGSALMEKLIDFARNKSNASIITLEVRSDNDRAIALYKKFGFTKFGQLDGFLKIDGKLIPFDYMYLKL